MHTAYRSYVIVFVAIEMLAATALRGADLIAQKELLRKLSDAMLTDRELLDVYKQLTLSNPIPEEAPSLVSLANSEKSTEVQRVLAIHGLLSRHIRPGMSVGDVAAVLKRPRWLKKNNISAVGNSLYDGPPRPLETADGETLFSMITASASHLRFGISLRVEGESVSAADLFDALQGANSPLGHRKLTAIALRPEDIVKPFEQRWKSEGAEGVGK